MFDGDAVSEMAEKISIDIRPSHEDDDVSLT